MTLTIEASTAKISEEQLELNTKKVLRQIKNEFVRIPSQNGFPKFRDLISGLEQQDSFIILNQYYKIARKLGLEVKKLSKEDMWLHIETVRGYGFLPNGPKVLENDLINMWNPSNLTPSGAKVTLDDIPLFNEFLDRWFPVKEEKDYFIWWIAHCVRRPEERINATILLRSEKQVGKGFFAETLMSALLDEGSVAPSVHLKDLVGEHNDILEGKTFVVIDEVYKQRSATANNLKSIQANKTFTLRIKHKGNIPVKNYLNFVVTSNDQMPITLEKGERRFWVPQFLRHKKSWEGASEHEAQNETDHFINDILKPWLVYKGGFQKVRDFLECVDLSKYRATSAAPMTEAKGDLMGFSTQDRLEETLSEYLESVSVVTVKHLQEKFIEDFGKLHEGTIAGVLLNLKCLLKRSNAKKYYITSKGQAEGLNKKSKPSELEELLPKCSGINF